MNSGAHDGDHGCEEHNRLPGDGAEHPFEDFRLGALGRCFDLRVHGNPQSLDVGFGGNAQRFDIATYSSNVLFMGKTVVNES